jgi:hypothetical protein
MSAAPRLQQRVVRLAVVLAGLLSVAAGLVIPAVVSPPVPSSHRQSNLMSRLARTPIAYRTAMVMEVVKRKVYPYSIVPGGAESVSQAKRFMTDPAIQVHYANMDLGQLKQERLKTNLTGYVSYRWGEKIYWTAKKITLRAGETVFTDGAHIVRGRCLNCYSAFPMLPIRPHEPTEVAMDTPVEMPLTVYSFPRLPVLAPELPIPAGELTPIVPVLPVAATSPPGKKGGLWFPLIPIIPPIHHHPGSAPPSSPTSPTTPTTPLVPPVVAVVPEPNLGWVLAAGCFSMFLTFRRMRARNR